ncbi:hypothetical protein SSX86_033076, partial [Deinandra increscens subsp. villosa]
NNAFSRAIPASVASPFRRRRPLHSAGVALSTPPASASPPFRRSRKLEKRISGVLEHATVDDLLILSYRFDGERVRDMESVRRIVTGFVEKKSRSVINYADFNQAPSPTVVRVAKTVDAYLHEIASDAW